MKIFYWKPRQMIPRKITPTNEHYRQSKAQTEEIIISLHILNILLICMFFHHPYLQLKLNICVPLLMGKLYTEDIIQKNFV